MVVVSIGKHCATLLGLFCTFVLNAQNLVKNPSFEQFVTCPIRLGNFNADVTSWSTPTEGSTDYFNGCSTAMGTPKNFNGVQPADFGQGYAGLYLYAPDDYREYVQAELSYDLVKGRKYKVSFYISLAERSDFAVKEFGVLFSSHKLEIPIKKELSKKRIYQKKDYDYNFFEIGYSNFYSDTHDWMLVHSEFVAKGTEKYMVIGNFKNNARTRMFKTKRNAKQGAYYYIDMVLVEALDKVETASDYPEADGSSNGSYELDKIHVFKNLLFEFDRFRLRDLAKEEMHALFEYLKTDTTLNVMINGHTDSVGTSTYNEWLSRKRAEAVARYLLKLGLAKDRILWQGHGGKKPIASNDSEQGRQLNRRVEFKITKTPF